MNHFLLLILFFILGCVTNSAPMVVSTVESYGSNQTHLPLFFVKDNLSLQDKHIAVLCAEGAAFHGVQIEEKECDNCTYVTVKGQVGSAGVSTVGASSFSEYGGTHRSYSYDVPGRTIEIHTYSDKELKKETRIITIKSVGPNASIARVAYEMCRAGFKDFPQDVESRTYSVPKR